MCRHSKHGNTGSVQVDRLKYSAKEGHLWHSVCPSDLVKKSDPLLGLARLELLRAFICLNLKPSHIWVLVAEQVRSEVTLLEVNIVIDHVVKYGEASFSFPLSHALLSIWWAQ